MNAATFLYKWGPERFDVRHYGNGNPSAPWCALVGTRDKCPAIVTANLTMTIHDSIKEAVHYGEQWIAQQIGRKP